MIINNAEYVQAYTEVNCLLKYMPFSYINRLPEKLLTLIENQSDDFYYIEIDPGKGLTEQGLFQRKQKIYLLFLSIIIGQQRLKRNNY